MPYEFAWHTPDQILVVKVIGNISDQEVLATDTVFKDYLESSSADKVHVIFDDTQVQNVPKTAIFAKLTWGQHPKVGWVLSVGLRTSWHRFIAQFMTQYFGFRGRMYPSMEAALAHLYEMDDRLPKPS
jgi:hypothetical protein